MLAVLCKRCNKSQRCWANNVESCFVRVGSSVKTNATAPNNIDPSRVFVMEIMCHACASPQQCWKSCSNGCNIVALHLNDHETKEMLGVVGSKVSNNSQQHAATFNSVCKQTQHVTSNNVATVSPRGFLAILRVCKVTAFVMHKDLHNLSTSTK